MRKTIRNLAIPALAAAALPVAADTLPEGEGREIVEYACSQCHDLVPVTSAAKTPPQWRFLVQAMIAQGAPVESDEIETVIAYLSEHFGEK